MRLPTPTPNPVLLYLYRAGHKLKKSHVLFYCIGSEFAPPSGRSERRKHCDFYKRNSFTPLLLWTLSYLYLKSEPSELLWKYTTDLLQLFYEDSLNQETVFYPILKKELTNSLLRNTMFIYWNASGEVKDESYSVLAFLCRVLENKSGAITVTAEKQILLFLGFIRSSLPTINHNDIHSGFLLGFGEEHTDVVCCRFQSFLQCSFRIQSSLVHITSSQGLLCLSKKC